MTVIVGAGLAGWRLAQALDRGWARAKNREPLVLLGDRTGLLDKISLGEWATGVRDEPPTLANGWVRAESRFVGAPVVSLSVADRTVTDQTGTLHHWDRLVLTLGSEPVVPAAFSQGTGRVFAVSSRTGAEGLRVRLAKPGQRLLVVGGGPLGVECAWNLAAQGHQTTLVHRGSRLLEPFLDTQGSHRLAQRWAEAGVALRLGVREVGSTADAAGCRVAFDDGTGWTGDAIVVACGAAARTDLARTAGLKVAEAGILTFGEGGQTSQPGIYAVGDCAAPPPGEVPGLWEPARNRVDRIAAQWTGQPVPPSKRGVPVFRLKTSWPVVSWGDWSQEGRATAMDHGETHWRALEGPSGLAAWQVVGPWPDLEARVASLEAGTVALELPLGPGPDSWPGNHIVCDCHRVSVATVRKAWETAGTLAEVGRATQAGTSCGNCRPRLSALSARSSWGAGWRGRSWRELIGYAIDFSMLVTGVLTALTGVIKMPGFLDAVGLDQRSLPDEANMALSALLDLHDWPGIVLTVLVVVHGVLHWGMMVNFVKSLGKKTT